LVKLPRGIMNRHATIFDPKRVPLLLWGVPFLFLLASAFLSSRIDLSRERAAAERETIRSPGSQSLLHGISLHPAFTFGFQNLFADISWLEAVQVAGNRKLTPNDYNRLALMIQAVIHFDPRFKVPYLLGGLLLGDSRSHVQEALRILEQGKANHPDDWRFPFYLGYLYYFSLGG